jgi:hypothetical protein
MWKGGVRMRIRIVTVLVLVIALCGFVPESGYSSDNEINRESIRGIKGVHVFIEILGQDEIRDGLTADSILKDVESRLRQNGITVLTEEGMRIYPGNPLLYIKTNFRKMKNVNTYVYSLSIEFYQNVTSERNKLSMRAVTWNSGAVGYTPVNKLNSARKDINGLVDRFINAYLSVNPR